MSSPMKYTLPGGDLVARMSHQHLGQGRLAGPVGTHQGMYLAPVGGQIDPAQDRLAIDRDMKVFDSEQRGGVRQGWFSR